MAIREISEEIYMYRRTHVLIASTVGLIGAGLAPGTATAAGPVVLDGWVTTAQFMDPLPFPTASYTGEVDESGTLTVRPDCVKGGLGGPAAPCLPSQDNYVGINDRVLNWQNLTTGAVGSVQAGWDGAFVASPGAGQVNIQVVGSGKVIGAAVGSYSA